MSNLQLFVVGAAVGIPAAISMTALVLAAIADGRANDRARAEAAKKEGDIE